MMLPNNIVLFSEKDSYKFIHLPSENSLARSNNFGNWLCVRPVLVIDYEDTRKGDRDKINLNSFLKNDQDLFIK